MKKTEIECGERYVAKVTGKLTLLHIIRPLDAGGWLAVNCSTGRTIRVRSAARLRRHVPLSEYQVWLKNATAATTEFVNA